MSPARAWLRTSALGLAVVIVDQATKAVVEAEISPGERVGAIGPLQLTNVENTGIAFGLASGGGIAIVAGTVIAIALILAIFGRDPTRSGAWAAVGLLAGGALGNLVDRLSKGAVTDFIDLPAWPAFNVADIAITVGVIALSWALLTESGSGRDGPDRSGEDDPAGDPGRTDGPGRTDEMDRADR